MIGHLNGRLALIREAEVVIECGGVGYRVLVGASTLAGLPELGDKLRLATHLAVREDALTLYGFSTDEERELFETLLQVSGVGPKLALAIVGGLSPQVLVEAISSGDEARLTSVPGVGKRVAQRLVLELRDKIGERGWARMAEEGGANLAEVIEALTGLGFTIAEARHAARAAVAAAGDEASLEELIRRALKAAGE